MVSLGAKVSTTLVLLILANCIPAYYLTIDLALKTKITVTGTTFFLTIFALNGSIHLYLSVFISFGISMVS